MLRGNFHFPPSHCAMFKSKRPKTDEASPAQAAETESTTSGVDVWRVNNNPFRPKRTVKSKDTNIESVYAIFLTPSVKANPNSKMDSMRVEFNARELTDQTVLDDVSAFNLCCFADVIAKFSAALSHLKLPESEDPLLGISSGLLTSWSESTSEENLRSLTSADYHNFSGRMYFHFLPSSVQSAEAYDSLPQFESHRLSMDKNQMVELWNFLLQTFGLTFNYKPFAPSFPGLLPLIETDNWAQRWKSGIVASGSVESPSSSLPLSWILICQPKGGPKGSRWSKDLEALFQAHTELLRERLTHRDKHAEYAWPVLGIPSLSSEETGSSPINFQLQIARCTVDDLIKLQTLPFWVPGPQNQKQINPARPKCMVTKLNSAAILELHFWLTRFLLDPVMGWL